MCQSSDSGSSRKPEKPSPDFPLTPRNDGRWMKKIHGKVYTFSGSAEQALARYENLMIELGADAPDVPQIRHLCEAFMCSKQTDLKAGQITQRTFNEYHRICDEIVAHFGRLRPLDELRPADAESLRARLISGVGLKTQSGRILLARGVFKYGVEYLILSRPFHNWIKTIPARKLRRYKAELPSRMLTAKEIKLMVDSAGPALKAAILLGINAAFGNADIADLKARWLDLDGGWHTMPRGKTGESRRGKLWPETVTAIRVAMSKRPAPKDPSHADLVFLTKYGTPWIKADRKTSPLSAEFRKLATKLEIYRPGMSFYSLRHVFATTASGSKDQVAVNYVMGHVDGTMAREYRELIDDSRLVDVAEYVRAWMGYGEAEGLRVVG